MTQSLPLISVVTPSFNQGQFLEQTIQSVLQQNYPNFEHIVVDGASKDNSVEVLRRHSHLKWISEPDNGQSAALNKAFRMATGEIIGWINADDFYEPNAFNLVAEFFAKYPDKSVVMGDCNLVEADGKIFDKIVNTERGFKEMSKYWVGKSIPTQPSIFFRRKLLEHCGVADESLYYAMDYDLWLRFAQHHRFFHIDATLANYRFHQAAKGGSGDWSKFVPEWKKVQARYVPAETSIFRTIVQKTLAPFRTQQ